jgi:hypothetical protein
MLYNKQKFVKYYLKQYFKIISNLPVALFFLKLSPCPPCGRSNKRAKMEGVGGRKFLPASQSEAPPPHALSAEAEAEKFSFPFRRKNRAGAK